MQKKAAIVLCYKQVLEDPDFLSLLIATPEVGVAFGAPINKSSLNSSLGGLYCDEVEELWNYFPDPKDSLAIADIQLKNHMQDIPTSISKFPLNSTVFYHPYTGFPHGPFATTELEKSLLMALTIGKHLSQCDLFSYFHDPYLAVMENKIKRADTAELQKHWKERIRSFNSIFSKYTSTKVELCLPAG